MLLSSICTSTTTNRDRRDVNEGRKERKERRKWKKNKERNKARKKERKGELNTKEVKEWKLGLFSERSGWLSLPKYAGLFKINLAKAIFSTKPASWIKEASIVHLWKQSNLPPCELHSLYWYSTLPHRADIFSNYVINTMAGPILEKVHYNCIQSFIS